MLKAEMADDQGGGGDGDPAAVRAAVPELRMAVELFLLTPLLPACVGVYLNYVQTKWAQFSWATAAFWIEFLVIAGPLVIQVGYFVIGFVDGFTNSHSEKKFSSQPSP